MNDLSKKTPKNPLIKSWFGFVLGAIIVGISLLALTKNFTIARLLSTLGFLCFWYPWNQITGWNNPIKNFFKAKDQVMSKFLTYLILIATLLLISSAVLRLMNITN